MLLEVLTTSAALTVGAAGLRRVVTNYLPVQEEHFAFHLGHGTDNSVRVIASPSPVIRAAAVESPVPEELQDLARTAKLELRQRFGPDDQVFVREFFDQELSSPEPEYFLVVGTRRNALEAVRLLDQFLDSWWLEHDSSDGRMHVTVEFPI